MQNGHININLDFSNRGAAKYLADRVHDRYDQGYRVFKLRPKAPQDKKYPDLGPLFPTTCVPIAGTIDYFKSEYGCTFIPSKLYSNHPVLGSSGIINPYEYDAKSSLTKATNCVWRFTPETHHKVIDSIIDDIRQTGEMSLNVVQGLELVLNEVTDNIIQHSLAAPNEDSSVGYVMAQYHWSNNRIAVTVFDYGQGIRTSLGKARKGLNLQESLKTALERGVTGGNGAGNGLWMMSRIIEDSAGQFSIASDNARYSLTHPDHSSTPYTYFSAFAPIKEGTTLVDFQLNTNQGIEFAKVLDGYEPIDLWYESHLNEKLDEIIFCVAKEAKGTRSRRSAAAFANLVLNTIKGKPEKCVIDFDQAPNMSASFADELILAFVETLGFTGFFNRVDLLNLSPFNQAIVDSCMNGRFERK